MKKIILSEKEVQCINKHLRGEIDVHSATDEEQAILSNAIDNAMDLMAELDAYDESLKPDFDLLGWYLSMSEQ